MQEPPPKAVAFLHFASIQCGNALSITLWYA